MKLRDIILTEGCVVNEHGRVEYGWNREIFEEEGDDYLPDEYDRDKVLELKLIEAAELGSGHGAALMNAFLSTVSAREAELIFLDPSPYIAMDGKLPDVNETEWVEKLVRFYRKFGFRNNPRIPTGRMWRVQKGDIPDELLPT